MVLMQQYGDEIDSVPRLLVTGRVEDRSAEVEFMTALEGENMEDRLAYLGELSPVPDDREVSYRLLRHYASSVSHQKYHGMDIVTVDGQEPGRVVGTSPFRSCCLRLSRCNPILVLASRDAGCRTAGHPIISHSPINSMEEIREGSTVFAVWCSVWRSCRNHRT